MRKHGSVGARVLVAMTIFLLLQCSAAVACRAGIENRIADGSRPDAPMALTIFVKAPDGGERWAVGGSGEIKWWAGGGTGTVTIDLDYSTTGSSGSWKNIKNGLANTGTYYWTVPNDPSTDCYVRGTAHDQSSNPNDVSNASFEIYVQNLTAWLKDPHGGETWEVGQIYFINWAASGGVPPRKIDIEYSVAGPSGPWKTIVTGTNDVGGYSWTVPNDPSTNAYVRLTAHDSGSQTVQDKNNASFSIQLPPPPVVYVQSPNGGENWTAGDTKDITWWSKGKFNKMNISYSTAGPSGPWTLITDTAVNIGVYSWAVPNTPSKNAYVKVFANDVFGRLGEDIGNASFTISPPPFTLSLNSPIPGDNWLIGSQQTISWTISGGTSPFVSKLEYSVTGKGGPWKSIASGISSTTYSWTIPDDPSTDAYVKVTATDSKSASASGMNSGEFVIYLPKIIVSVTKPNGGETLSAGTQYTIQWSATGGVGTLSVNVSYSTTGWSGPYTDIANDLKGQSSHDWLVPAEATTQGFVKVRATDGRGTVEDTSNNAFTISTTSGGGNVKLLTPSGTETWNVYTDHDIVWKTFGTATYTITLKFSTKAKTGPWTSIAEDLQDTGKFKWRVPDIGVTSATSFVRVQATDTSSSASFTDVNQVAFTINRPSVIFGITGTVYDKSNTTPLEDVQVKVVGHTEYFGWTDPNGTYLIPYAPAGTYKLEAWKPGYKTSTTEEFTLNSGETKTIDIWLESEQSGAPRNAFLTYIADNWQMLLFLIILIIILLAVVSVLAKRRGTAPGNCKMCRMPIPPKQKLCANCASRKGLVICPKCKKMLPKGVTWCTACGEILPGPAPTQASGDGSSIITVTMPAKCPGCDKQVDVNTKAVRCTCGALYHKECSDAVEICRKCKKRVRLG